MRELLVMLPDALLFGALCTLVLVAAFVQSRRVLTWSAIGTVLLYLWGVSYQASHADAIQSMATHHLQTLFALDASALGMKAFAGWVALAVLIFLESLVFKGEPEQGKEGCLIVLFGLLGASLMVGASHFLMSYLGLELLSLALVVLIAWGMEAPQLEAAIKYFILSSLASGLLLFGVSLMYGSTGHLTFTSASAVRVPFHSVYVIGQIFLIAGVAFKLGWVPFHFWISDVYASARWYTVVALSSLSKIGVVGFMIRLLDAGVFTTAGSISWAIQLIVVLSILSILIGNILAVQQRSIRRILAYSSIANMGFLGLALISKTGAPFYLAIYVLSILVVVAITFYAVGQKLDASLDDLKGFALRHPVQGAFLSFAMLSMAGLPITPGFWTKWHVFKEFFAHHSPVFAIFVVLGAVIGTFYYIRVVKYLYEETQEKDAAGASSSIIEPAAPAQASFSYAVLLAGLGVALLWCTASPDSWLMWSARITGTANRVAIVESPAQRMRPAVPLLTEPSKVIVLPAGEIAPRVEEKKSVAPMLVPQSPAASGGYVR